MSSLTCYSDNNGSKKYGWENCYSASNNFLFNSPAQMADGRLWSQWQPDAVVNQRIQRQEGIQTNWGYRQYLQKNGLEIILILIICLIYIIKEIFILAIFSYF